MERGQFSPTAKSSDGVPLHQNRSRDIYSSSYMLSFSSIGGRSRSRLALNQVFQLAFTRVAIPRAISLYIFFLLLFFFLARRVCALTLRTVLIYCGGSSLQKACGKVPHLPFHKITSSSALHGKAKRSFKISFLREGKAYKPRYPIYIGI